ncbi:hypothetical protein SKA53_02506 [Yoonia vestfoldensis SKA53]|jgi:hypothetical protein|uniref:Uncharacterized protein n=1 Tax=Yoonia vestfoldensis SKA53 TaxID=314232 RepID=A3V424_9RHOB|nr:hypothetical protein SKA53_02506 [Yoonia vestfoldensis SKA53]
MLMNEKPKKVARHGDNIAVKTTQTGLVRLALVMEQMGIATPRRWRLIRMPVRNGRRSWLIAPQQPPTI